MQWCARAEGNVTSAVALSAGVDACWRNAERGHVTRTTLTKTWRIRRDRVMQNQLAHVEALRPLLVENSQALQSRHDPSTRVFAVACATSYVPPLNVGDSDRRNNSGAVDRVLYEQCERPAVRR